MRDFLVIAISAFIVSIINVLVCASVSAITIYLVDLFFGTSFFSPLVVGALTVLLILFWRN